jgi:hypothetical protein
VLDARRAVATCRGDLAIVVPSQRSHNRGRYALCPRRIPAQKPKYG